jgi:hypothetical protein
MLSMPPGDRPRVGWGPPLPPAAPPPPPPPAPVPALPPSSPAHPAPAGDPLAVPASVVLARVLLITESTAWLGIGVGVAVASVSQQVLGYLVFSALIVALSGRGAWSASALGRLDEQARTAAFVLALMGLPTGIYAILRAPGISALLAFGGMALILVNGAIVYSLDTTAAQAAFRRAAATRPTSAAVPVFSLGTTAGGTPAAPRTPAGAWLTATRVLLIGEAAYWLMVALGGVVRAAAIPGMPPAAAGAGCGCADGFGLLVAAPSVLPGLLLALAGLQAAAALIAGGAATWAAIALRRSSRAAHVVAQLLAFTGAAIGLAFVIIGMENSNQGSLVEGLALVGVNAVIIAYVAWARSTGRPGSAGSASAWFAERPPLAPPAPPTCPPGYPPAPPAGP